LAVLGASIVLAVAPLSTVGASLPTETKNSQGGCEAIDPQHNWSAAKVCRDLNDGASAGTTGVSNSQPSGHGSSSGSYLDSPLLWAVAILGGAAGAFVAIIRRHRPAALS
jgi:hypothetical protein